MMTVNQKIASVRTAMEQKKIDAVIVPSADPHISEYVSDHWKTRAYISGFTGSAGTFVITGKMSGLWTDGRYYVQAAHQLESSEATLFRAADAGCPTPVEFLAENLASGSTVGFNGRLFTEAEVEKMHAELDPKGILLNASIDDVNTVWETEGRPAEVFTEAYALDPMYTGRTASDKLSDLRSRLAKLGANAIALSKLDHISWLFNIRSNDVECNPVVTSYAFVSADKAILFTDRSRIPTKLAENLAKEGVSLNDYEAIYSYLADTEEAADVLCDANELNASLYAAIAGNTHLHVVSGEDPILMMKAIKNETENTNTYNAYRKDGCALAEFYGWLFEELEKGTQLTEYDCSVKLGEFRYAQPLNRGDSFTAIVAYRSNAAMAHYAPQKDTAMTLERSNLLLIDSGGQYLDGTTDTTRTVALGPITEQERQDFTTVFQGALALMTAKFPYGQNGKQLDGLCREHFWQKNLDYRHGTGHGVGYMLNVHEGPHSFRSEVPFEEGMVVTVEPGIYIEGSHGIRTENVVHTVKSDMTEYGQMMEFKLFTVVPIDTSCLDISRLTQFEIDWLNNYHKRVWEEVSPLLSERGRKWLEKSTAPITK